MTSSSRLDNRAVDVLVQKYVFSSVANLDARPLELGYVHHWSSDPSDSQVLVHYLRDRWTRATSVFDDVNEVLDPEKYLEVDDYFCNHKPFDDGAFFDILHRAADRQWPWAFLYITPYDVCVAALRSIGVDIHEEKTT